MSLNEVGKMSQATIILINFVNNSYWLIVFGKRNHWSKAQSLNLVPVTGFFNELLIVF